MTLFSEIYGLYFRIASEIISKKSVCESEINENISRMGFRDSMLFLPQKLIPQKDGSDWGLLRRMPDGSLKPVTQNPPIHILSTIQKMWLKAKLSDPKIGLFLTDKEIKILEQRLTEEKPLYREQHFRYTDMFSDGDDFSDSRYRNFFKMILNAVKTRELLEISFTSGHGKRICGKFIPIKIEYSQKNDKFRVHCYPFKNGRIGGGGTINIGRIDEIKPCGKHIKRIPSPERFFEKRRCSEPVTVRVTGERNGVERFMNEFAAYEKRTERNLETGEITVKLFYDIQDETELLIRLLGFGPVLEIISPDRFRQQAVKRIEKQYENLHSAAE